MDWIKTTDKLPPLDKAYKNDLQSILVIGYINKNNIVLARWLPYNEDEGYWIDMSDNDAEYDKSDILYWTPFVSPEQ